MGGSLLLAALLALLAVAAERLWHWHRGTLLSIGSRVPCRPAAVIDGDSLVLHCSWHRVEVRVWGIDAPELAQAPWGSKARMLLGRMVDGSMLELEVRDRDRYGRTVAVLRREGEDLGLHMVREGAANVYDRYNALPAYRRARSLARAARRGIWSEGGIHQEPWRWRASHPRQ